MKQILHLVAWLLFLPMAVAQSIEELRARAEQGNATAQNNLGVRYADGDGVPRNDAEAVKWYRLAVAQGNAMAKYNLGMQYENGLGVVMDVVEAARLYREAADHGVTAACYNLGMLYASGQGVVKNEAEAAKWYLKAAEQGNRQAQYSIGGMYAKGGLGIVKSEVEAAKWYLKAAEQGDAHAQAELGRMYLERRGAKDDLLEGLAWFYVAMSNGRMDLEKSVTYMEEKLGQKAALKAQERAVNIAKEIRKNEISPNVQNNNGNIFKSERFWKIASIVFLLGVVLVFLKVP